MARINIELDLAKKELEKSKRHDTSKVCYKCKGNIDASASTSGDILIKLK